MRPDGLVGVDVVIKLAGSLSGRTGTFLRGEPDKGVQLVLSLVLLLASDIHISSRTVLFLLLAITPWIALVSCDFNATNASQETDIFNLAKQRGAVSAVSSPISPNPCRCTAQI